MIVQKITLGYVVQDFDTETQRFVSQRFVVEGPSDFSDERGFGVKPFPQYLAFDMVQPDLTK